MIAIVWSKKTCPFCVKAKELLDQNNIPYEERTVGEGWTREQLLTEVPNARTVPQIFIDNLYIGGYNELVEHLSSK
jgi:glutaredoxin 3